MWDKDCREIQKKFTKAPQVHITQDQVCSQEGKVGWGVRSNPLNGDSQVSYNNCKCIARMAIAASWECRSWKTILYSGYPVPKIWHWQGWESNDVVKILFWILALWSLRGHEILQLLPCLYFHSVYVDIFIRYIVIHGSQHYSFKPIIKIWAYSSVINTSLWPTLLGPVLFTTSVVDVVNLGPHFKPKLKIHRVDTFRRVVLLLTLGMHPRGLQRGSWYFACAGVCLSTTLVHLCSNWGLNGFISVSFSSFYWWQKPLKLFKRLMVVG